MRSNSAPTQARVMASNDLRWRVESVVCDRCQDLCWSVECWLHGIGGSDAKACVLYREHLAVQSEALLVLARWLFRVGGQVASAEAEVWIREHQTTLW